jgi:hypothetical protein
MTSDDAVANVTKKLNVGRKYFPYFTINSE